MGDLQKESFIEDRLKKNKGFFEPIPKKKLNTLADMAKTVKVKTSTNREVQFKQQSNVAFHLLMRSQQQEEKIEMLELMKYPLMPVPSSIGTADGYLLKTDKSKGFAYLTKGMEDADVPVDQQTFNIEDGNATFYTMNQVPSTFKQISEKLFDITTSGKSNVLFSTDMYKEHSIKSLERSKHGSGEALLIKGENTQRPEKWKEFLSNDSNKQHLVRLILKVRSMNYFCNKLENKTVIVVCEQTAYLLSPDGDSVRATEIPMLQSDQEEIDTRVILYCNYAIAQKFDCIRVRSPDSEIFFYSNVLCSKSKCTNPL